jgi:sugar/nucleoside kinase (ribokinase family)
MPCLLLPQGANQAVAAARLSQGGPSPPPRTRFVCKFGNDSYATMLQQELAVAGVDVSGCGVAAALPSGQGVVLLEPDGTASSVVLGGSNTAWREVSCTPCNNLCDGRSVCCC